MTQPLVIDYYSDVLCIWSWIAQRRNEELSQQWGERVHLRHHYLNLFGSVDKRMAEQWNHRGGIEAFAKYVQKSAASFEELQVHPQLWLKNKPTTSLNAHLMIKATELEYGEATSEALALALRKAFYLGNQDISQTSVILSQVEALHLSPSALQPLLDSGKAGAALMEDYQQASVSQIKGESFLGSR